MTKTKISHHFYFSLLYFAFYRPRLTCLSGAFGKNLPYLQTIRLDHNSIIHLEAGTFLNLPRIDLIRLRANPLQTIVPGTFENLPYLERIEMNGTNITTDILGSYDSDDATSIITFAQNCPKLRYLELGTFVLYALYPNYFQSNNFFNIINRIGEREMFKTDLKECDSLNRGAAFSEEFGAIVCQMSNANGLTDAISRREKSHLISSSRL